MQQDLAKYGARTVSSVKERLLLLFSAIGSACIVSWLLGSCQYGFDFTDEGYYLVWISNPFIYDWSATQFGFVYHPLYRLLGGDIVALRQANILITFCLAWILVNILLKTVGGGNALTKLQSLVIAAGFATASLLFLNTWLPTPSYNSLALQALLVAAVGLLLAGPNPSPSSLVGWALLGLGGWLAFMAKPTTAMALSVCVGLYLLLASKLNARLILFSVGIALAALIVSGLAIDDSLIKFVGRLRTASEFYGYLDGGHSLAKSIRFDRFHLRGRDQIFMIGATFAASLAAHFCVAERERSKWFGFVLATGFLLIVLVVSFDGPVIPGELGPFQGLLICTVPLAAVMAAALQWQKYLPAMHTSPAMLAMVFVALPYVYAFGTSNNYWQVSGNAGFFWLLAGLVWAGPILRAQGGWMFLAPLTLATQAMVSILVQTGTEAPYRQMQPLRLNSYSIRIGATTSTVTLSAPYGTYIADVVAATKRVGLQEGTPVIDMSGVSPGILYAMHATAIGQPWTVGGYPGSLKLASEALKRTSCKQVTTAWLLTEPDGPGKIPVELLASFGARLSEGYELVASWETQRFLPRHTQNLLRPIGDHRLAEQACEDLRLGRQVQPLR